jgi:hypothetical protein
VILQNHLISSVSDIPVSIIQLSLCFNLLVSKAECIFDQ